MQKFKLQYADKVVVPFHGASFRSAKRLLELVGPLADHHSARDKPPAVHLSFILDHYSDSDGPESLIVRDTLQDAIVGLAELSVAAVLGR